MFTKATTVYIPSKGPVTLRPSDHLATGGEGAVYLRDGLVFKIFLDPVKAQANGMDHKVALLSQLKHPFIVAPTGVLHNKAHEVIGYYMPQAEGEALMRTFTNSWRDLNNFGGKESASLVENMRTAVQVAHDFGAVMVDANETNYLVRGVEPRVIDVDSWQVGAHKATAIMPSVRDYHAKAFDANTDWFSWAVVSFQVFTGIHPYKGTHPDFKRGDLEARMRANASVFDSQVRLNTAVRDFSCVPPVLLDWYQRVFSQGERSAPPSVYASVVAPKLTKRARVVASAAGTVKHDRVIGFAGDIRHVSTNGFAFYSEGGALKAYDLQRRVGIPALQPAQLEALFRNEAVLVRHEDAYVYITSQGTAVQGFRVGALNDPQPQGPGVASNSLPLAARKLLLLAGRIFALNPQGENGLVELELCSLGKSMTLAVKSVWPVNLQATQFFDGFAVMDCLGTPFIALPEGDVLEMRRAAALAGYKLINGMGRSSDRVWLHGIRRDDGQVYRLELQLQGAEFVLQETTLVDDALMNVAVTLKGIAVGLMEDGALQVRSVRSSTVRAVMDSSLTTDMQLFTLPDGVYYYQNKDVFKLTLSN